MKKENIGQNKTCEHFQGRPRFCKQQAVNLQTNNGWRQLNNLAFTRFICRTNLFNQISYFTHRVFHLRLIFCATMHCC